MTGRPTQLDIIHVESDSEFSSPTGSDPEHNPAQTEASSSDDDVIILDKPSSFKESSSDKAVEGPDTDSEEDKDQQTGKCNIKHKTPRTSVKRKIKKEKMNEHQVKTVTIKTRTKRQNGKRSWDKKHYCLYCGKPYSKVARHLKRKHMEIEDVAYTFSFPVGSKYRKALLDLLRSKGDLKHNAKVLEKCRRQLMTCKQPSSKILVENNLPCTYCYGMFARKELWKHQSSCRSKKSCMTDNEKNKRRGVQSHTAHLLPIAASSNECQRIINNMQQDDVSFHIRTDSLICRYGEALHAKHQRVKSRHQYIAQRMRELGRFMLVAKDMDKTVKGLEDLCAPSRFQFVVSVTKKVTECSSGKNEYEKPPNAAQIRFCLKGAVEVLIRQTLRNDDDLAERKARQFLELLDKNWKNHVSVSVHQTIQEKRWNKQDDIPLTKNVMTLRDHLRMVEELEQVARFRGHDIRVHRNFYRQRDKTFQIAKMSKLLFAMEQGTETLKGKNLNTINPSVSGESPTSISDIGPQKKGIPGRVDSDDGCPDLLSTQKGPDSCSKDETSDVDVENPMSPSETVPHTGRKRAREVDDDGCLDLFSPRQRLDPCNEDDQSPGISLSQRLSPRMKSRKQKKAEKQIDEGSDLFCPEKSSEDGNSDRDDQRSGKNLVTQKKKKKKREKQMVKGKEPHQATVRRPWSEAERMAVEKHLGNFLAERRVPWKEDCLRAIQAEKALSERSWKNVKDYVCNKIVTLNLKKLKY